MVNLVLFFRIALSLFFHTKESNQNKIFFVAKNPMAHEFHFRNLPEVHLEPSEFQKKKAKKPQS